jgi:WS/DGAT/MGAT family acyltransferase
MKLMKSGDAGFFIAETPTRGMQVAILTRWSHPKDAADDWLRQLVERWRSCRDFAEPFNLRRRPGPIPAWEELAPKDIDLDYHLRHSALPYPGGERELGVLVSRLDTTPLDRERPLWEMHVIEGLENGEFALFVKVHHAQFDGMGIIALLKRVFSKSADTRDMPAIWEVPPPDTDREEHRSWTRLPIPNPVKVVPDSLRLGRALVEMQTSRDPDNASAYGAPKTIINGRAHLARRIATQSLEVDRFSRIAKRAGVSQNDVALCISAGGLRTYLFEQATLPEKSLTAGIPVSVRGDSEGVGNAISFIIAKLHTDIADPVERLQAIHRSTTLAKDRFKKLPNRAAQEAFGSAIMGPFFGMVAMNLGGRFTPVFNIIISNVPGSRDYLYYNGARMEALYPISVPIDGQALNITFLSYAGTYKVGFTACRESVPSMQRVAVATGEALDELEELVLGAGSAAART